MTRIARILLLLFGTVIVGAAGFKILGGDRWTLLDSLYMVIITLSTVGFKEVHSLSPAEKIWTIFIISGGIGVVGYAFSQAAQYLSNFSLLRRKRMESKASHLKYHFIVCGYGRMGKVICEELSKQSLPFVVIESSLEKSSEISAQGYINVQGDATLDETLEKASIREAKGLVVVLSSDADNLFVTMSARTLNPELFITSRYSTSANAEKLLRAGANKVVNPYVAGGHRMAELLVAPYVEDSFEILTPSQKIDFLIEEINLKHIDRYDGVTIRESRLREDYQLMIAGVIEADGDITFSPDPNTRLSASHTLMLMGEKENLQRFKEEVCEISAKGGSHKG